MTKWVELFGPEEARHGLAEDAGAVFGERDAVDAFIEAVGFGAAVGEDLVGADGGGEVGVVCGWRGEAGDGAGLAGGEGGEGEQACAFVQQYATKPRLSYVLLEKDTRRNVVPRNPPSPS
jgi:hypothetical protein